MGCWGGVRFGDSGSEDGGRSSWFKGAFSAAEALRAHNYNEVKQRITAHILESKTLGSSEASRRVRKSLCFVRGFFNESLTPKLPQNRGIGPAMYVKTVAFSSCEAEYASASYACKESEFVRVRVRVRVRGALQHGPCCVEGTPYVAIAGHIVSGSTASQET